MSLASNTTSLATRIATELKSHKLLINGNVTDLSALLTTEKGDLVGAINEVFGAISGAGASIDDNSSSGASVWSSSKTGSAIASAVADLVNGAPAALDTLNELAAALDDDPNFATTITSLIGGKADNVHTHVSADLTDATTVGTSVLTAASAGDARSAIGAGTSSLAIGTTSGTAADAALVGDTTTNFVTTFEAGL